MPYQLVTPEEPEYSRTIKAAIVTDLGSNDPAEEVESIVYELETCLEANVSVVVQGRGVHVLTLKTFDLLVLDYGGASVAGGTQDLVEWQIRCACEWAENHPGKVLLLWTSYTALEYGYELEAVFGHLDNVMVRFGTKPWNMHDEDESVFTKIQRWFWPEG